MDWISVKDRLPEVWVTVLLWDGHHMVSGYLADDGIIVESWWCSAFPATHWMMPEPPKEESDE